jgi:hypothetical protein
MDDDLPGVSAPQAPRPKRRKHGLWKLCWDTGWGLANLSPIGNRLWKEGASVKRYPTVLLISVLLVGGSTWYFARQAVEPPYTGETTLKLFFPGEDRPPQLVYSKNIYRYSCYVGQIHVASPGMNSKGEPITISSEAKMWTIFIIFQREVNFDVRAMQWRSTMHPPPAKIVFHECGRRGASFMIPQDIPVGQIEFMVESALPDRDNYSTIQKDAMQQPSPTPNTEASPH